ncbi:IS21 family transposase [Duganella sp. HH101]|uniref:IS21 family transposase n=1 Tax=Duganella sp. HH101 TaxID=1781066 RepID=UPI00143C0005|nr:IS21 family transposase [Duganella sp. HH101]
MRVKKISMRMAKDILSYVLDRNMSQRGASQVVGVDRTVVAKILTRYKNSGVPWPMPSDISDDKLKALLYPKAGPQVADQQIHFDNIHLALQQRGATLAILHQEWVDQAPESNTLGYQQFCKRYSQYRRRLRISMRRVDQFGEVAYVDYSGMTVRYFNPQTMRPVDCQVFIGVLGGSLYTFCEATHTQRVRDWLASHVRMFTYFGGVPRVIVPDNLKAAVTKADRFFPTINESYQAMCHYYGTTPFPARARKPKDKPKAEAGVSLAQRWILFVLRNRRLFSLAEVNREISVLLTQLNSKEFQKKSGSRFSKWIEHERPALLPLPSAPYELAEWGKARAEKDYHVEVEGSFYSVPYQFRHSQIEYRMTEKSIEFLHASELIACHIRSNAPGSIVTLSDHQPPNHKAVSGWSAEEALSWASTVGVCTVTMLEMQIKKSRNFLSGYRTTEGMKWLCKKYGNQRVEEACTYASANKVSSMEALRTILSKNLDTLLPQVSHENSILKIDHENIRGADYYARILNKSKEHPHDE